MASVGTVAVVLVLWFFLSVIAGSLAASLPNRKWCKEGQFYDHGTELCEPCSIICKYANITNTVLQCQTLCPKTYAQLTNEQKRPELSRLSLEQPKDSTTSGSPYSTVIFFATVTSGIVVLSFLVILGAFVCKRVQDNSPQNPGQGQQGSTDRSNSIRRDRQGYRPAGVQEEEGGGEENSTGAERRGSPSQEGRGGGVARGYCDPRQWFSYYSQPPVEVPAEETVVGRQGTQEIALLGTSQGSVVKDLSQPTTVIATPIYKPSGSMRSSRI